MLARLLHLCWELCCLQLLVLKFLDQKIVRPTMATMVLFGDVSLDTMASLRSEGIFSANICVINVFLSINYYPTSPPNQGLLDLPAKWWIEVQRVLFDSGPEDAWWVKHLAGKHAVVCLDDSCWLKRLRWGNLSQVKLSQNRAATILENYHLNGTTFFLAAVAKKHLVQVWLGFHCIVWILIGIHSGRKLLIRRAIRRFHDVEFWGDPRNAQSWSLMVLRGDGSISLATAPVKV